MVKYTYHPANGPQCQRCGGAVLYCRCPDRDLKKEGA